MSVVRRLGRVLLAGVFLNGAKNQFANPDALAKPTQDLLDLVPLDVPVPPARLVQANAAIMAVAGTGLALGLRPRWCAAALAAVLVPTTVAGHRFWDESDPTTRFIKLNGFLSNAAILGGLLVVASEPTPAPTH